MEIASYNQHARLLSSESWSVTATKFTRSGEADAVIQSRNRDYPCVWSAAELQAKNEEWQLVYANVFGLQWGR
jgi:hypothetical protein